MRDAVPGRRYKLGLFTKRTKQAEPTEKTILHDSQSPSIRTPADDESAPHDPMYAVLTDWSGTGRGSHVDFSPDESVPLQEGRFLGKGANGFVLETSIKGHSLAWKKIFMRSKIDLQKKRKEVEVLKRLSHVHMVQMIGTYTHRQHLGILLYPVALCDLDTFHKDVEAHWTNVADDIQTARLTALNYFESAGPNCKASAIYTQFGCLISAIDYLHSRSIRHKDLKPSNILLLPGKLYLTDFGTATDFSLLSQSATDNGGGTPRYFAPEVANYESSGRAADIFSLGCVLLESLVLHHDGTLKRLRVNRSNSNPAYHANLNDLDAWLPFDQLVHMSTRDYHLARAIRSMLSKSPGERPSASTLLTDISLCDKMTNSTSQSMFGHCCQSSYVSTSAYNEALRSSSNSLEKLKQDQRLLQRALKDSNKSHRLALAGKEHAELELYNAQLALRVLDDANTEKQAEIFEARAELETLKKQLNAFMDIPEAAKTKRTPSLTTSETPPGKGVESSPPGIKKFCNQTDSPENFTCDETPPEEHQLNKQSPSSESGYGMPPSSSFVFSSEDRDWSCRMCNRTMGSRQQYCLRCGTRA